MGRGQITLYVGTSDDDHIEDLNEFFTVSLSNFTGAVTVFDPVGQATIINTEGVGNVHLAGTLGIDQYVLISNNGVDFLHFDVATIISGTPLGNGFL